MLLTWPHSVKGTQVGQELARETSNEADEGAAALAHSPPGSVARATEGL